MVCINNIYWRLLGVFIITVIFAGCSGAPKKAEHAQDQTAAEGEQDGGGEPPMILIANPYLDGKPSIPAKAKEEFAKATVAMNAGQWGQAEGLLRLMTETYPQLSGPFVNLGISLYNLERVDEAETALKQAIVVNSTNMDAYTWLGYLYREQGRFSEAEQNYLAALEIWPHHSDSHRNLGILYDLYMGRFDEALKHYQMLQRILPEEDRQVKGWIMDLQRRLPKAS